MRGNIARMIRSIFLKLNKSLMYVGHIIIPQFWKNRNICMILAKLVNYTCQVNQLNHAKHSKHCIKGF